MQYLAADTPVIWKAVAAIFTRVNGIHGIKMQINPWFDSDELWSCHKNFNDSKFIFIFRG